MFMSTTTDELADKSPQTRTHIPKFVIWMRISVRIFDRLKRKHVHMKPNTKCKALLPHTLESETETHIMETWFRSWLTSINWNWVHFKPFQRLKHVFYTSFSRWAVMGMVWTEIGFSWSKWISSWTTVPLGLYMLQFQVFATTLNLKGGSKLRKK